VSSHILLLGGSGFIGARVARALEAMGCVVQRPTHREFDLARDTGVATWLARLEGIDVVVNAAGLFQPRNGATLEDVHALGPAALFEACARRGVRVVHFSALGADEQAASAFHRTKRAGDEALLALPARSIVLQPSLVFGQGGTSARLFATLAALPIVPLPGDGTQRVQPLCVEDVAEAVAAIVARDHFPRTRLALVGPHAMTLRDFLGRLRAAIGLGRARFVRVPLPLVRFAARWRAGLLDRESLAMLERGNTASAAALTALLGRAPREVPQVPAAAERALWRLQGRLGWLLPMLRLAIACMWLAAGAVSLGLYPVAQSLELLARTGLTGTAAWIALYGAALLDLAMGVASLAWPRRWLWRAQIVLVLGYTAIITVFLPEQWLHPYGPVVKNVVVLAALLLLHETEER
jgi:uncharacterized protein YbjT (DUF2867 family)